ncbi:hypothetical protein ACH95_00460 [Bacillus glycinifermentans]|nr:hypothetical protein ACH95_00460 [Bacillus glycinifermentans]
MISTFKTAMTNQNVHRVTAMGLPIVFHSLRPDPALKPVMTPKTGNLSHSLFECPASVSFRIA